MILILVTSHITVDSTGDDIASYISPYLYPCARVVHVGTIADPTCRRKLVEQLLLAFFDVPRFYRSCIRKPVLFRHSEKSISILLLVDTVDVRVLPTNLV